MSKILLVLSLCTVLIFTGISLSAQTEIIPKPVMMKKGDGTFALNKKTRIHIGSANEELKKISEDFIGFLSIPTGFRLTIADRKPAGNFIDISIDPSGSAPEGYKINVLPGEIRIAGGSPCGVFYAFQTLRQLLPPEIENKFRTDRPWQVPEVEIEDYPRFEYRGFMLDVARHFQPFEVLKRYVDLLSFYKINHFHLHLTDDQGWRIEIKKYPKLQEISAWRKESVVGYFGDKPRRYDGIRHGGYYTRDQLKELVKYARDHFITIVPEIELPGHSTAAIAAYPELACFPKKFEVTPDYGVFEDVYCTKESTFRFLEDVLAEVVEIFPGKMIHIGGDECPKNRWKACPQCQQRIKDENLRNEEELQSYFIKRIQKFLNSKGKNIIGWDEIMEGGLAEGATLMYWRTWLGIDPITEAARSGFKVIMSPLDPCYFNLYEDKEREITPLAYPGLIPLKKVYDFNPVPEKLTGTAKENILGVQANLWSEYVLNDKTAEYMTFPRLCALSETAWSPVELKNYSDFIQRLKVNSKHLEFLGVNYSKYFLKYPDQ